MTYIKICASNEESLPAINKYLKLYKNKKPAKVNTEQFFVKNGLIIIDNKEITRETVNTIKLIDDILDKYEDIKGTKVLMAISENKNDLRGDFKGIKSFIIFNPSDELKLFLSRWSLIKNIKIKENHLCFDFNFYTAIEYSKTTKLKTENGDAWITAANVKSHNLLFTIFRVGEIKKNIDVRVHYICETSEIFDSVHCDCKRQLQLFKKYIFAHGGILIYCHEEGRGLGLKNKINAYWNTEKLGLDTVDAMVKEAGKTENRLFEIPADIIQQLKIKEIKLWTNNPLKIQPFIDRNIVVRRVSAWSGIDHELAKKYIKTKKVKMQHYEDNN